MCNLDVLFDEEFSGDCLFGGDSDITHSLFGWVEVDCWEDLAPLFEFAGVLAVGFRVVHEIVEDGSLRWELNSCFPFTLPPVGELLSVVESILLGQAASTTPDQTEDKSILQIGISLLEEALQHSAERDDHGNRGHIDQQLHILLDVVESPLHVLLEQLLQVILCLLILDLSTLHHLVTPTLHV